MNKLWKHIQSFLKFGTFLLIFTWNITIIADYIPTQLEGKFTIKENDTLWGSYWLSGKIPGVCGNKSLICTPSAMVDEDGVLWTASFEWFQDARGLGYELDRHESVNSGITTQCHRFYPWTLIPDVEPKCSSDPNLKKYEADESYFKNYIHNILQPCVAQEIGTTSYVCMFIYCPPTRYMSAECSNSKADGGSVEGLMYFNFYKDDIKNQTKNYVYDAKNFYYHTDNRIYSFYQQHLRKRSDMNCVNLETGNYTAWHNSGYVHLNFIATKESNSSLHAIYHQYNNNWQTKKTLSERSLWVSSSSIKTYPRYIKFKDYVYGMIAYPCWDGIYITKQGKSDSDYTIVQNWAYPFNNITHSNTMTAHNYDFCIVKAKDGTGIVCVLGLRPTCASSSSKTELSAVYNKAWQNSYTCWNSSSVSDPICLMLSSCMIDKSPSSTSNGLGLTSSKHDSELCYESPQNIIYSTGKTSFSQACSLYCTCYTGNYEYKDKQLFKNTHKCCVYTASSGNQYIIYAYCYPGKTKKCYFGYARCIVDSNYKVQLLSKTEFSKGSWGESIDKMNYCDYIVSLDCRGASGDEHIWLTWRHGDSTYYIFHIKAKDLVGE